MSTIFKVVALLVAITTVWYLVRNEALDSLDSFYDGGLIPQKETLQETGDYYPIEKAKKILDEAYISAHEILAKTESAKSILELKKGIEYLKKAIRERNILAGELPERLPVISKPKPPKVDDLKEFCPENYTGSKQDHPLYINNIALDPTCKVPPLNKMVTVIFNFVDEIAISKAETIFEDAAFCIYQNMTYVAFVKKGEAEIPKLISIAKAKLPNMHIIEKTEAGETHGAVLHEAVSKVKTKYVVLTRNTERFDNFSTIVRLVRDISLGKAEVIGASHRNISGHWKAGCYQMKQLRGEIGFDEGYDLSDNACMYCDYISGPFGVKTENILKYLSGVKESKLTGDFFYMEYFFHVRLNIEKRIFMCIDSMFYTETVGLLILDKEKWFPFQEKMSLSKVTFPDHKTTHEFECQKVNLKCLPQKDSELPFCCYKDIETILTYMSKYLRDKQIQHQFHLPNGDQSWTSLYQGNPKRNIILIGVSDLQKVSDMKYDGFSWSLTGYEFSSTEWRLVFIQDSKFATKPVINIRFNKLLLPVNTNPAKALLTYGKDVCTKNKICFNLLHFYEPFDYQKVWI